MSAGPMDTLVTVEMALLLGIAAGVALALLLGVMTIALHGAHHGLQELHGLAADGLLGQARGRVPQPLAGSDFEALVHALDRGDTQRAEGSFARMVRRVGGFRVTGWLVLAPLAPLPALLPLLTVALAALTFSAGATPPPTGVWHATTAAMLAMAALAPLALTCLALALHLHALEGGRRSSAAAGLIHHAGKELH